MPDYDTVERMRQQLIKAAPCGSPIGKGGPTDHAAQRDAIVKPHRPGIESRPAMLRPAYVVHKVSDHQRTSLSMDEHALLQSKAVDRQLSEEAGKSRFRRLSMDSIDAEVVAFLSQARWSMQLRRRESRGPLANPEMMEQVRRIEVRYGSERFDGGVTLGRHGYWRVEQQAVVAQSQHLHRRSEPQAEKAHRFSIYPDAFGY
jgi:hypothetical protein